MNRRRLAALASICGMLGIIWWPGLDLPGMAPAEVWKDALHAPFFTILTLLVFALTPQGRSIPRKLLFTLVIALLLACITEIVQPAFGRTASFSDLLANGVGVLIALSGLWVWRRRGAGFGAKAVHAVASLLCILVLFLPALRHWQARDWPTAALPELAVFGDHRSRLFWRPQGQARLRFLSSDDSALRVSTRSGSWSGVSFYPGALDISGFSVLVLELENPDSPTRLGLRIDDDGDCSRPDSRYGGDLELPVGLSSHRISLREVRQTVTGRPFNMKGVTRIALFRDPSDPPCVFLVKRAFLE